MILRSNHAGFGKAGAMSKMLSRRRAAFVLLIPAMLVSSSLFALRWFEYAVTFQPDRYKPGQSWVVPNGADDVSFLNQDGQHLDGWFMPSKSSKAGATVMFLHGQGGNISNVAVIGERLAAAGFNVLLFDYRGYGKSEGEISGERDMYADADAAYDYLVNARGIAQDRLFLYGHSLGTAAVVDLASRRKCAGIILESGLSSASDIASFRLPWLPAFLHGLARNRFDSASKLASVLCPVLVAHGEPDNVVPTEEGRALYAAAREPKKLVIVPGAGHVVWGDGGANYFNQVTTFMEESLGGGVAKSQPTRGY
jgi:pimeloyl-ACP methyl ester carboxylesterase